MGGDSPLDMLGDLCDVMPNARFDAETDEPDFYCRLFTRKDIDDNLAALIATVEKGWDDNLGFQVLGAMMMHVGCEIHESLRSKIADASNADEWLKEAGPQSERGKHIADFQEAIRWHVGGTPTKIAAE